MKKLIALLLVLVVLAACAPPTPEVVEKEVVVEKPVVQTVVVEKEKVVEKKVVETVVVEKVVTPTPMPTPAPKYGGTLIAAKPGEVPLLDPHIGTATFSKRFFDLVYNGLVRLDENSAVAPELAESWDISDDGKVYTFQLRKGVKFHNGKEMTSEDVKASYERILDPETGSPARSFYADVVAIATPDPHTVVFTLDKPNAALLALMASPNAAIVPKEMLEAGDLSVEAVGTGPFKLGEWMPDNYMILERHPDFFIEGRPYLDAIEFRVLPDEASILAGLRAQTIDYALIVDPKTAVLARVEENLQVKSEAGFTIFLLAINHEREPLDNPLVRMAVACAIDRQAIIDATALGEGEVTGPLAPSQQAYFVPFSEFPCYQRDLDRSSELLIDAGFPDGVKFNIVVRNVHPYSDIAEAIQAQLREAGIEAELEVDEVGIFVERWRSSDFDTYVSAMSGFPDPDFGVYRTFHGEGSANVHGYSNAAMDELLEAGRTTHDPEERTEIYKELQRKLVEDVAAVFLYPRNYYQAMQQHVKGFTAMPTGSIMYLRDTWLDK